MMVKGKLDLINRQRKKRWLIAGGSLAACLIVLLFTVLVNKEGTSDLETKLQPTEQVNEALVSAKAQIQLTESEDKRIAVLGDPKSESGMMEEITVRIDKKTKTFTWRNSTNPSFYPEVWLANVAGDDNPEVIIALTQGTGTGLHQSEVHVLKLDFSEIKVSDPKKAMEPLIQTNASKKAGKPQYSITVSGKEHLFEYNETDAGFWFENVAFGNVIHYRVEDRTLIAEFSAQVSPGTFPGTVKLIYALKSGVLEVSQVEWIDDKTTGKVRALGQTAWGELQIFSENQETMEALGAPSCLGIAEDYSFQGNYQVQFINKAGKKQ